MGDLNESLAKACSLLKKKCNEEVIELLSVYLENSTSDYMLFCYAGLAYSNIGDFNQGYTLYKKAIQLDSEKLIAWKGAFKVIEACDVLDYDDMIFPICEKIIGLTEDSTKVDAIRNLEVKIALGHKQWKFLLDHLELLDEKHATEVLDILLKKQNKTSVELSLVESCFEILNSKNSIFKDRNIASQYCKHLYNKNKETSIRAIVELCETFPEEKCHVFVQKCLLDEICGEFLKTLTIPELSKHLVEGEICSSSIISIINYLGNSDITGCLEFLDKLSSQELHTYPCCLLFIYPFSMTEDWITCETLIKTALVQEKCKAKLDILNSWSVRIALERKENLPKNAMDLPILPMFLRENIFIASRMEDKERMKTILSEYSDCTKEGLYCRILAAIVNGELTEETIAFCEKLLKLDSLDWNDLLLAAEHRLLTKKDATNILVKAAKLNPRSSKVFFMLARSVKTKNPAKAKSCLERAVKIQPDNEEYVKELYMLYSEQNVPKDTCLKLLTTFAEKRSGKIKPVWVSEYLSSLFLESGNLDGAISELQQLVRYNDKNKNAWARLAEAYFRKGHLKAAVSSYDQLSNIEGGHEYKLPMIRVLIQLSEYENALEKVEEFREQIKTLKCLDKSKYTVDILEAQIRLNLLNKTYGDDRKEHLKCCIKLVSDCVKSGISFSISFKMAGECLLKIAEYSETLLSYFEIDQFWNIKDRLSCVQKACSCYANVVRLRENDALAWHDLAVALILNYQVSKNVENVDRAKKCLKRAFKLTKDDALLSIFWTVMARALSLTNEKREHQLHCLSRALQLNKTNDAAWLMVAILFMRNNEMNLSTKALELALKYNPHNADAWCAWAHHAHMQNAQNDALMMFRQALSIKPSKSSLEGYTSYICHVLRTTNTRFDPASVALEFEPVAQLREMANCTKQTLYELGLLSELFGYFENALECFKQCHDSSADIERIELKLDAIRSVSRNSHECVHSCNNRLHTFMGFSNKELLSFLTSSIPVYQQLCMMINEADYDEFRALYVSNNKNISIPLFVALLILFDVNLHDDVVETIHEALPRHELIDYFPTILPEGMDNGLRHLEEDGEVPFRYRHFVAKELVCELKNLREQYESSRSNESLIVNQINQKE